MASSCGSCRPSPPRCGNSLASPRRCTAAHLDRVRQGAAQRHPRPRLQKAGRVELTNTLLAHHDGTLPHNLALLGYLYLLDVLAHPDVLRKHLYRGGNA